MRLSEPMTMATDYLLSAASVYFALALVREAQRRCQKSVRLWALGFFASAAASLVGGTFHGFRLYFVPATARTLWSVTIFLIGAGSAFMIAGTLPSSVARQDESGRWLLAGLFASLAGVAIQQSPLNLHPSFNHNDLSTRSSSQRFTCSTAERAYCATRGVPAERRGHSTRRIRHFK